MNYEVNDNTLAIVPYSKECSKVIEYDEDYIIKTKPYEIMEYSCEYFGSSLEGRIYGSKKILGTIYKVPLVVEDSKNMIFFPTKSPSSSDNMWISLKNIDNYKKIDNNKTLIIFKNNKEIIVRVPFYSIDNQILRAARLESVLRNRKSGKKNDFM